MTAKVAAILLAAGAARRMGSCKQLLPFEGKTVVAHCLETLLAGGIGELVVVVSPEGEKVARAVMEYPVQVARNSEPEGDMAVSVCTGRNFLSSAVTGVVVALCDYPLVKKSTISRMIEAHSLNRAAIIIPSHNNRRGHPPLFPRQLLDQLKPPLTLRDLLRGHPEQIEQLSVSDRGVLIDMDTPEDYRRVIDLRNREECGPQAIRLPL